MTKELEEVWDELSATQKDFCINYQHYQNKRETAEAINVQPNTVYRWPDKVDEALHLIQDERLEIVNKQLQDLALSAVQKIPSIMESDCDHTVLAAIKFVINHAIGKATQRVDQKNEEISSIDVKIVD